ncbi:MAG: retropepsin-like aspartic protease [Candidatus Fervidibacter sacchari]
MSWTRFDPTATFIRIPVRIVGLQGVEWLGMALDTGSNRTVLSELAAIRLGYDLLSTPTVRIVTASGIAEARLIFLRQIFALGMTVDEFPVLVMPLPTQLRADGLLGLDFLRLRNLFCNFEKGILLTLPFSHNLIHRFALSAQIFAAL